MGPTFAENTRPLWRNCWKLPFSTTLLFALWLVGCNNTCFTFTSNPPTTTIGIKASDPSTACTLTKANGTVRLGVQTVPVCSACPESVRIQHIFVSIRGIDVHSSSTADDSLDWQELAPQLAKQPLQVDLVRGTADQGAMELLGESVVLPAGAYRQVRVRFVPNPPATDDRVPEKNACGNAGFNCLVMADGTVQAFLFETASAELRITSERIVGGFLLVFPDTESELVIELKPVWSWVSAVNKGVRLVPALTGNARVARVEFDELGTPAGEIVHGPLPR
jgi:hypothetical protein